MKYVGSKNRISKEIVPIIQSYVDNPLCCGYIEPFVGGANIIDKISCHKKIGCDSHKYLIALLKQAQSDISVFPDTISEDTYHDVHKNPNKYFDWFVGLVGFCSFGGKWFGGYPRGFKSDGVTPRDIVNESIRNLIKQSPNLSNVQFYCKDFRKIIPEKTNGYVIYCDPPYKGTTKYSVDAFNYDELYEWCRKMSVHNIVIVSEYEMPNDFKCIWKKEIVCPLDCNSRSKKTEKLFILE